MGDYIEALANVIIDVKPAHSHRVLMQTQPGWIHSGTDFFITDAGLVGSETTIGGFEHFSEKGISEFTRMAKRMSFVARWGSSDGAAFDAASFLDAHPQFEWQARYLKSRPAEPWIEFKSGE